MGIWGGWKDFGSVTCDLAQGHVCFHVLMFLLLMNRNFAGEWICRYEFPFQWLTASLDLQGRTPPSLICILHLSCRKCPSNHPYLSRASMTWRPSSTLFFFKLSFLFKKRMNGKLCGREVDVRTLNWTQCSIWISLKTRRIRALAEVCFLTIDHACTLLECVKVLPRGKNLFVETVTWTRLCANDFSLKATRSEFHRSDVIRHLIWPPPSHSSVKTTSLCIWRKVEKVQLQEECE